MEIWSTEGTSFVDFADGYSYLSVIPPSFGVKREAISPFDLSTVLHEFTHQLALKGPFGWTCAYFQALRPTAKILTELSVREMLGETYDQLSDELREKVFVDIFSGDHSSMVANYHDLISAYRPLLEGLALFVQLDFQPSKTFDIASDPYLFMQELINTEFHVSYFGSEPHTPSLEEVFAQFAEVHAATHREGLLQLVFEGAEADPYFWGYLLVKGIQRRAAAIDPRLADPEVFFIFLQSYLFHDGSLVELCTVDHPTVYQNRVADHLATAIDGVVNADPRRLRTAVDAICEFQSAEIDSNYLDFAAAVREGETRAWQGEQLYLEVVNRVEEYVATWTWSVPASKLEAVGVDSAETLKHTSMMLFDILTKTMLAFKLRHSQRVLLGYHEKPGDPWVSVSTMDLSSNDTFLENIEAERFSTLKREIEAGAYIFARDDSRLSLPPADRESFEFALVNYLGEGRLLVLQDYDMYLVLGQERCKHLVRGDFTCTLPYFWERTSEGSALRSPVDSQLLEALGGLIFHETYRQLLQVVSFEHRPLERVDAKFVAAVYRDLWQRTFAGGRATPQELDGFVHRKAPGMIAKRQSELGLLRSLLRGEPVSLEEGKAPIAEINRRWRYFTGHDLILPGTDVEPSQAKLAV
jgi:hypothetical protein